MKYGCIGEHLAHSFSREIHNLLSSEGYELVELSPDELDGFMKKADFLGINVTIPYKEAVIPYLYHIDESARSIGCVNTVVNRDGKLFGYNTDFYGMISLIKKADIQIEGKKVVILGSGGTSKTARAVSSFLGASECITVSRKPSEKSEISYEELYSLHTDAEVIINTTPVGMYPRVYDCPINISAFSSLVGVIDVIYNPIETELVREARERKIKAVTGLYMLVSQAARASEIFLSKGYSEDKIDDVYNKILKEKQSVVLIGMPSSGKSTVGRIIAEKTGKDFIDTDTLIEEKTEKRIFDIFLLFGEEKFRECESEVIREVSTLGGKIIATGGGAILRKENIDALRKNGKIFFIDRPLSALVPTEDRPLSSDIESLEKKYKERYYIYKDAADVIIDADCTAEEVAEKILAEIQ